MKISSKHSIRKRLAIQAPFSQMTEINNLLGRFLLFLFLSFSAATLISCSSDDIGSVTPELPDFIPPTAEEFNTLREEALHKRTDTVVFNAEDGINYLSENDAQLFIPMGCLSHNGTPATGEAELIYTDLYHRKDMLVTNKPVMGVKPNGNKAMLVSGGEFFIEVRQNDELLDLDCQASMLVPSENTGGQDDEMILWDGTIDEDGNLTWEEKEDADLITGESNFYSFNFDDFGSTNIDRFYTDSRSKTTMQVQLPEGFDNENSAIYLSYKDEPNALAQFDVYDEETGIFSEHYGEIPIGLKVHIIFASGEGDNWRYAIQTVTIEEDKTYVFTLEETETGTEEELISAIEDLP